MVCHSRLRYNSPYLLCGGDRLKMLSTVSQRKITERQVVCEGGKFVAKKILFVWVYDVSLFVLCEGEDGRCCVVEY